MKYLCTSCGNTYDVRQKIFRCSCNGFLSLPAPSPFPRDLCKRTRSIWRYRESYGLPDDTDPVSLGEGSTPVIRRAVDGSSVFFKLEYMQPSGSFKDRGASVLISLLRSLDGVIGVVEDSSGNAGSAISAYSAACGLECTIYTPEYTPGGKLTQMLCYGARVKKIPGNREQSSLAAIKAAEGAVYASHLWNPYFTMGLQSAAFEIWEEFGNDVPQLVFVPAGSGGFLEALYSGFTALHEWGYTQTVPRLVGVQADYCAPLHIAYTKGLDDLDSSGDYVPRQTVAEGIAVPKPPRARAVLEAVRGSGGYTIGVSENEIIAASKKLYSMGIFVEPTSASVLAGWLKADKSLREGALLLLTGSGLKETAKLASLFSGDKK
jgi:threonine synthase